MFQWSLISNFLSISTSYLKGGEARRVGLFESRCFIGHKCEKKNQERIVTIFNEKILHNLIDVKKLFSLDFEQDSSGSRIGASFLAFVNSHMYIPFAIRLDNFSQTPSHSMSTDNPSILTHEFPNPDNLKK